MAFIEGITEQLCNDNGTDKGVRLIHVSGEVRSILDDLDTFLEVARRDLTQ